MILLCFYCSVFQRLECSETSLPSIHRCGTVQFSKPCPNMASPVNLWQIRCARLSPRLLGWDVFIQCWSLQRMHHEDLISVLVLCSPWWFLFRICLEFKSFAVTVRARRSSRIVARRGSQPQATHTCQRAWGSKKWHQWNIILGMKKTIFMFPALVPCFGMLWPFSNLVVSPGPLVLWSS